MNEFIEAPVGYLDLKWLAHAAAELPMRPDNTYDDARSDIYIALGSLIEIPERILYESIFGSSHLRAY